MDNNIIQTLLLGVQILTLVALIVYVWETRKMALATQKSVEMAGKSLDEMKEQRDAEIAPYVVAYLDGQGGVLGLLYLVIKNTGKTVAKNVKIKFNPPLQTRYPDLLKLVIPDDGIPSIPPGYEIRTMLDTLAKYEDSGLTVFTVQVTYFGGIDNKQREDTYYVDLKVFNGIVSTKESTI